MHLARVCCILAACQLAAAADLWLLLSRPATAFDTPAEIEQLVNDLGTATAAAIGVTRATVGTIAVNRSGIIVINVTTSVVQARVMENRSTAVIAALANSVEWNRVRDLGVQCASDRQPLMGKTNSGGVPLALTIVLAVVALAVSTGVSLFMLRRKALRRSRSVKFKDLVKFEIEMAAENSPAEVLMLPGQPRVPSN